MDSLFGADVCTAQRHQTRNSIQHRIRHPVQILLCILRPLPNPNLLQTSQMCSNEYWPDLPGFWTKKLNAYTTKKRPSNSNVSSSNRENSLSMSLSFWSALFWMYSANRIGLRNALKLCTAIYLPKRTVCTSKFNGHGLSATSSSLSSTRRKYNLRIHSY